MGIYMQADSCGIILQEAAGTPWQKPQAANGRAIGHASRMPYALLNQLWLGVLMGEKHFVLQCARQGRKGNRMVFRGITTKGDRGVTAAIPSMEEAQWNKTKSGKALPICAS